MTVLAIPWDLTPYFAALLIITIGVTLQIGSSQLKFRQLAREAAAHDREIEQQGARRAAAIDREIEQSRQAWSRQVEQAEQSHAQIMEALERLTQENARGSDRE